MLKFTLIIAFLFSFLSKLHLSAQETSGLDLTTHFGITYTSGNSDSEQFNIGVNARNATEQTEVTVSAYYDYGRTDTVSRGEEVTVTNLDKGKLEAKANRVLSDAAYGYINFSAERDEIAGIERRVTGGPGLGRYFRREDDLTLAAEAGVVWVFEKTDKRSTDYAALRLAQNFDWALNEGARIRQKVEAVADFSDQDNYFINATVTADATLTDRLGLRLELRNSYNNLPGAGKEENDLTLISGLTVQW